MAVPIVPGNSSVVAGYCTFAPHRSFKPSPPYLCFFLISLPLIRTSILSTSHACGSWARHFTSLWGNLCIKGDQKLKNRETERPQKSLSIKNPLQPFDWYLLWLTMPFSTYCASSVSFNLLDFSGKIEGDSVQTRSINWYQKNCQGMWQNYRSSNHRITSPFMLWKPELHHF